MTQTLALVCLIGLPALAVYCRLCGVPLKRLLHFPTYPHAAVAIVLCLGIDAADAATFLFTGQSFWRGAFDLFLGVPIFAYLGVRALVLTARVREERCQIAARLSAHKEAQEVLELSPETSHPKAAQVLTDAFFWDCTDDDSPLGNDTGADVMAMFRTWRPEHPRQSPIDLLKRILADSGITDAHWDAVGFNAVRAVAEDDGLGQTERDNITIGLAFAQIVCEGKLDAEVKRRTLLALERQNLPDLLAEWPEEYIAERAARVQRMKEIVQQPWD